MFLTTLFYDVFANIILNVSLNFVSFLLHRLQSTKYGFTFAVTFPYNSDLYIFL